MVIFLYIMQCNGIYVGIHRYTDEHLVIQLYLCDICPNTYIYIYIDATIPQGIITILYLYPRSHLNNTTIHRHLDI